MVLFEDFVFFAESGEQLFLLIPVIDAEGDASGGSLLTTTNMLHQRLRIRLQLNVLALLQASDMLRCQIVHLLHARAHVYRIVLRVYSDLILIITIRNQFGIRHLLEHFFGHVSLILRHSQI